MENLAPCNDFRKAMGSIVLTAGASIVDAERRIERATANLRGKMQQDMALSIEFCRLLVGPVDDRGPAFSNIPEFPETYCRQHLSPATAFLRHALATHNSNSTAYQRLAHIAGLIEKNLKQHLDEKTAIRCWFGDATSSITDVATPKAVASA